MTDLLAALERVLGARRRRVAAVATVVVAGGLGGLVWSSAREPPLCQGAEENLLGVWDEHARSEAAQAFAAVERAFADDAWTVVEPRLDAFTEAWIRERTETCRATHVRHEQSESLMDLRMACLDRQLLEASALVELFEAADAQVAEKAVASVEGLPDPAQCDDVQALNRGVEPPPEAAVAEVEAIDAGLARVHALMVSGKYKEALVDAKALLERAEEIEYGPSIAHGAVFVGQTHERLSQLEPAEQAYMLATVEAARAGDVLEEARALGGLCSLLGLYGNDLEAALRHCGHAQALFERLGNPEPHRANLELHRANALYRNRRLDESKSAFEAVLDRTKDEPTAQPIWLGALSNLSGVYGMQGQLDEALALAQEGAEWVRVHWGEHHPSRAFLLTNMGATCLQMGRNQEAVEHLELAAAIYRNAFGEQHADTARVYHNLGVAMMKSGDPEGALARYRQALEIKRAIYPNGSPSVAHTANNIADVLLQLGRPEEALEQANEAISMWEATAGPDAPDLLVGVTTKIQILLALQRPVERELIERGIRLAEDSNTDAEARARLRGIAAQILWKDPVERKRAIALAELALDYFQTVPEGMVEERDDIEAWLEQRR
jgi:tetratricopeptide (TPR) repeat protein